MIVTVHIEGPPSVAAQPLARSKLMVEGALPKPSGTSMVCSCAIEAIIDTYVRIRKDGERFIDTYSRVGADPFKEVLYATA